MKRTLLALGAVLVLSGCTMVDTTGVSKESTRPARGNINSPVVVTEFGDLQCPSCKAAHEQLNGPLLQKYGAEVRFEFRHFPIQTAHVYALQAAEASECAADQGKFWEFLDLDYTNQSQLSPKSLYAWADQLELNHDLFDRCVRSHIKRDEILADSKAGTELGVHGTPTYFVNGKQTPATIQDLSAAIEDAKKGGGVKL